MLSENELMRIFNVDEESLHHIFPFSFTTYEGNDVKGYISKSVKCKGDIYINRVNGEGVSQYVKGMPKFYGMNKYTPDIVENFHILLKEDGFNVAMYPLLDHNGECIEVIFKSRKTYEIPKNMYKKMAECITPNMIKAVKETGFVFAYEVFGTGIRQHFTNYVGLEITKSMELLGVYDADEEFSFDEVMDYGFEFGIATVEPAFHMYPDKTVESTLYLERRIGEIDPIEFENYEDLYLKLKTLFKEKNEESINSGKGRVIEGVVFNYMNNGVNHLVKCKDETLDGERDGFDCGIKNSHIKSAVTKAEENGIDFKDAEKATEYITTELLEDYEKEIVFSEPVLKRIYSYIRKKSKDLVVTPDMQKIYDAINTEENKNLTPEEKMQLVSIEFPIDKNPWVRKCYGGLFQMFKKGV